MKKQMTRKDFCSTIVGGSVLLLIQSCGGGGGSGTTPASGGGAASTSCSPAISANHGHAFSIVVADLDSASDRMFNIEGAAGHNHTLSLTVAQLRSLKTAGASVVVATSTTQAHQHSVTVTCL